MGRSVRFQVPADPSQFNPSQPRPRVLLGLSMQALARWLAAHLVPYASLVTRHGVGMVFTTVRLDYTDPPVALADADWFTVAGEVTVSDSRTYLRLAVEITAHVDGPPPTPTRGVARFDADMRVVSIVEPDALTAVPGLVPDWLSARFLPDEVYRPDRDALAAVATPPDGLDLAEPTTLCTPLFRTYCEVADQWSFIELAELVTVGREQLYLHGDGLTEAGRLAVSAPIRAFTAVFHTSMFVFAPCQITSRMIRTPTPLSETVVLHTVGDPTASQPAMTAWETLAAEAPRGFRLAGSR